MAKKVSKTTTNFRDVKLESLLEPISGKDPCGENVRYTDIYDNIREARREDDPNLSQGVWQTDIKRADWEQVVQLCVETITSKSKDLQVAAWLAEAWLHMEGMAGFVKGLQLIDGLTNEYWEGVYPKIENGNNYELRVSPFEWMNTKLSDEIQHILITLPSDPAELPYCYNDWQDASRAERMKKTQTTSPPEQPGALKKPTLDQVTSGIEQTPTAFFAHIDQSCLEAAKSLNSLEDNLRERIGTEMPSFFKIREKIDLISHFARSVLDDRGEAKKKAKEEKEQGSGKITVNPGRIGKLQSREQAYAQLEAIASFLAKIEPHSPTPYLIRRAISWGGMSLNEVVKDLMGQGQETKTLLYLLDIHTDDSPEP